MIRDSAEETEPLNYSRIHGKNRQIGDGRNLAKSRAAYFTRTEKNGVTRRIILHVCRGNGNISDASEEKAILEVGTWMSPGHGIVRVLFAANDIISGTAPADGVDRSRPRTRDDRERHRHVCMRLCVYVGAHVRACARRDRSRASAYSPSAVSARREVSAKHVYRDPGNNYR